MVNVLRHTDEKGSVLLEFGLSLMLLVTIVMGMWGFGVVLVCYAELSQVANEAVRTIASVPDLKPGAFTEADFSADAEEECKQETAYNPICGHILAHRRTQSLIRLGKVVPGDGTVEIESNHVALGGAVSPDEHTVRVALRVPVATFFGGVNPIPGTDDLYLTIQAQGPYLYRAN